MIKQNVKQQEIRGDVSRVIGQLMAKHPGWEPTTELEELVVGSLTAHHMSKEEYRPAHMVRAQPPQPPQPSIVVTPSGVIPPTPREELSEQASIIFSMIRSPDIPRHLEEKTSSLSTLKKNGSGQAIRPDTKEAIKISTYKYNSPKEPIPPNFMELYEQERASRPELNLPPIGTLFYNEFNHLCVVVGMWTLYSRNERLTKNRYMIARIGKDNSNGKRYTENNFLWILERGKI